MYISHQAAWFCRQLLSFGLVKDFNILVGGNSITNCNTRSTKDNILPMDMGQLDVVVGVEGDVEVLLGLGPLLVGGVSCPL